MKTWYRIGLLLCLLISMDSCKKFLEVKPLDTLSGNDFWKNKGDADKAIIGAYNKLLSKFTSSTLYNNADFRAGNWNWFGKNNLRALGFNMMTSGDLGSSDNTADGKSWATFYQAIAAANLCIDRIPKIEQSDFTTAEKNTLVAEAKFIRSFIYFFMVRMYGDVPLQFDAYDISIRPRIKMEEVLKICLEDLASCKDDLPVTYPDPANRAVRASQGAALTLMAHMNMWLAGFDKANTDKYWRNTADLTKAVMDLHAYELVPYTKESFPAIFKGRSEEGIFELSLDINYGVQFHSLISQWTLHKPIINSGLDNGASSEITPMIKHLNRMYPPGDPDNRFTLWFDDPYSQNNGRSAMFLKFSSVSNPDTRDYDANFILFRYADLILLRAEVLANLKQDGEAITLLNLIRKRAGARLYNGNIGKPLQDAIFLEREKELMGEGHIWYDLVRTGRVMDKEACENYLTTEQMAKRAWTWPIYDDAVKNNPLITQNDYWVK